MIHLTRHTAVIFYAAVLLCLTACHDFGNTDQNASIQTDTSTTRAQEGRVSLSESQYKASGITYGKITLKNLGRTLPVTGMLEVPPQNAVSVTIPFGGIVKSTTLLEGKKVSRGERLVTLENPEFIQLQQDYLDSKSQLEYLEAEYERQQKLSAENINAKKTLQKAKADYNSMLGRVKGLKTKLAMLNIRAGSLESGVIQSSVVIYSPMAGYVAKVNVNRGSYAGPNDELFRIVNADNVYVELVVFEKDISDILPGQEVYFTPAGCDTTFEAVVYLVGKEIRPDRSIPVICHIAEKAKGNFIPGMYVKANIETGSAEAVALPDDAIVAFRGKNYIFLPESTATGPGENYYFKMEEIHTGNSDGGFTAVVLPPGFDTATTRVVVGGAYTLLSTMMNSEEEE